MKRYPIGYKLGTCEIERFIAEGGMATVYCAHQKLMGRRVAVKVLRPELIQNDDALAAFLKEGMAGARLSHPSIAQVYYTAQAPGEGSDEPDDYYYIVMDFVDGADLKTILEDRGPFTLRKALEIIRQVAEVLAFAHDRGIVHRDIKPANIMMTSSGEIVLTDFGIAALLQDRSKDSKQRLVCGTPAFMPPEQYRGQVVDGRSDLYSLGATLYNLLSGKPPFRSVKGSPITDQVLKVAPPSLRKVLPQTPKKVSRMVDRLLAKKPIDRYQNARAVVAVIDEALQGHTSITRRLPKFDKEFVWRRSFWWPVLASVAALWIFGIVLFVTMAWAVPASDPAASTGGGGGREPDRPEQPQKPQPPSPDEPRTPIPRHASKLEPRIEEFCRYLGGEHIRKALTIVTPTMQEDPQVLNSLVSIYAQLRTTPTRDCDHTIFSQNKRKANVAILVGDVDSGSAVQIILTWVRDKNGAWYIQPDPRTRRIRSIIRKPGSPGR